MSLKNANKVDTNRVELEIEVDAGRFEAAVNDAYKKNVRKMNIPGFRKGKAPRHLVEKLYGTGVFYEDAVNAVYPSALDEAIKESGYEYVEDKIDFDVTSVGPEGLQFKATITVKPEVELDAYKGLKAEKKAVEVTDADVEEELHKLQDRQSRLVTVEDRAAEMGDTVTFDFEGRVDGELFEGGKAENYTLTLGSGQFIPGFEEQLLGKNPGDDVTVHVTFPAAYHAPELAGKDAEFRCHIHEIRTVAPYALDDVFAKEVGQCENMAEMRENMRRSLENYYAERAELELRDRLLRQAADTMEDFTPDPAEISKAVEEQLDTMSAQLAQNNLTLDDYCKFSNSTLEQLREDARPGAEEAVRIKALVRRVAQAEELHAHEEDVAQALSEICRANHMTMEELQPYYDDAFAAAVEYSILLAKVTKRIRESAVMDA